MYFCLANQGTCYFIGKKKSFFQIILWSAPKNKVLSFLNFESTGREIGNNWQLLIRHKRIGYDLNVMRQSACLVINPIKVDNFAAFFNCTPVDRAADSMMAPT